MTDDFEPVHLSVTPSGRVSVLMLLDLGGGRMGIHEDDHYKQIGEVHASIKWDGGNGRPVWFWYYDEEEWGKDSGEANTRSAAVAAILRAGGYRAVEDNASIPDLLEGL